MTTPLSVVVTTLNNASTLGTCLDSVAWADERLVLDSFSSDQTLEVARARDARILQHAFQGYAKQKQMAIDAAAHDWVLLLDADEALTPELAEEIRVLLSGAPVANAYTLPRLEQLFWRWSHPRIRMNHFLRLFDRRMAAMNSVPVHAAPESTGTVRALNNCFVHYGEPDIHTKVEKLNHYSTGLVEYKVRGSRSSPWRCVFYPPFVFLRSYLFKRNFLSGWAGFIGSVCMAFYAFMKYAKVYEHRQVPVARIVDTAQMPETDSSLDAGKDASASDSHAA